jgi:hypothetical protein
MSFILKMLPFDEGERKDDGFGSQPYVDWELLKVYD